MLDTRDPFGGLYGVRGADRDLCRQLGLATPDDTPHGGWTDLGEHVHTYPGTAVTYRVRVAISCWPAQFWRFDVTPPEGASVRLHTGSGRLADYWPAVLLFAQAMLTIEPLTPASEPAADA